MLEMLFVNKVSYVAKKNNGPRFNLKVKNKFVLKSGSLWLNLKSAGLLPFQSSG